MTRKLAWNVVFVLAAMAVGVFLSIKPWRIYQEQRTIADRSLAEMHQAESSRADLLREQADVDSPAGREKLARDAGYRKPGEVPVETKP